jgi:hypothetical protein
MSDILILYASTHGHTGTFRASRHWALRLFAVAMPMAMAFAVVATANHYVIDVIVGVALVLAALAVQHATVVPRRIHVALPGGPQRAHAATSMHGHD